MRKFQCLLFVLKRSYILYYIICMTVPLNALLSKFKVLPVVGILCHELPQPGIGNYTQVSNYHMLVIWMTKLRMF